MKLVGTYFTSESKCGRSDPRSNRRADGATLTVITHEVTAGTADGGARRHGSTEASLRATT